MEEDKTLETEKDTSDTIEQELDAILDGISKEDRHAVRRVMGMSMQMGGVISPQLELMKKMTPDHISEFLQGQREATKFQFKENRENKIFFCIILIIALAFVILVIQLLKDTPDIMEKVLYTAGGFVVGVIGGYGFGKTRNND